MANDPLQGVTLDHLTPAHPAAPSQIFALRVRLAQSMDLYLFWLGVCVGAFVLVCVFLFIDAGKHSK